MLPLRPGGVWAGYRIDAETDRRGPVRGFAGRDAAGRPVVLHVVAADEVDAAVQDRIEADVRVVAGLDHPHLVPVVDVVRRNGATVVVTVDVGGPDLRSELSLGPSTLAGAEAVATQIGSALDRLHEAGLVHGDVAPLHVQRDADSGALLLAGTGLHHALSHDDGTVVRHTAPEQVPGEAAGAASDIYGLGCTIFECLTGRVPFPAESVETMRRLHLDAVPPSVTALRPDHPAAIDAVLARALAKDPAARHESGRALSGSLVAARYASTDGAGDPSPSVTAMVPAAVDVTWGMPVPEDWVETWGPDWEDDRPSRAGRIAVGSVAVLAVVVGLLSWRAVATDTTLDMAVASPTSVPVAEPTPVQPPTIERLMTLVPAGVDSCVPPPEQPIDEPPRVLLQCPSQGVPNLLTLTLYADLDARDRAFDDAVAELGTPVPGEECALGRPAVHDYIGVTQVGRVACRAEGSRVDFVWTSSEVPVLLWAGGQGRFPEYHDFWSRTADRVDGGFPLPEEQRLLDRLPDDLAVDCRRDLALADGAGATLAVTCAPEGIIPETVSWLAFDAPASMEAWIDDRPSAASAQPPSPIAGACPGEEVAAYELGGTSGRVACDVAGRRIRLMWTRTDALLGSVAATEATPVRTVDALVGWWFSGGHRP